MGRDDHVRATSTVAATLVACLSLTGWAGAQSPSASAHTIAGSNPRSSTIRIVPPARGHRERLGGQVEIQTLIIEPSIETVEFLLDGSRTDRVTEKPYTARVVLADPPREQELEVRGYDAQGRYVGSDTIILNRLDVPFAVRIVGIRHMQANGHQAARVEAVVSIPRSRTLDRVEFYRGNDLVEVLRRFGEEGAAGAARTFPVQTTMEAGSADNFLRVVAKLTDGREREDAELLQGADYRGEINVQLVQLQVLVTDRKGNPASDLASSDFEVRENGVKRPVEVLYRAGDVPLVLGLAIDSSSSTRPIRGRLIDVSAGFLEAALSTSDRAFLVHFNHAVAVLQPPSGHKGLLASQLNYLDPKGGTALNDAILFSLLQYRDEPGRRALVVVTDGLDEHSRSEPNQAADFAKRLGVPIYFIQLDPLRTWLLVANSNRQRGRSYSTTASLREHRRARKRLLRVSEQTGGRLFPVGPSTGNVPWPEQLATVYDQIQDDLGHQHVLVYYSSRPPGAAIVPEVRVTRSGLELRSAVPLEAIE